MGTPLWLTAEAGVPTGQRTFGMHPFWVTRLLVQVSVWSKFVLNLIQALCKYNFTLMLIFQTSALRRNRPWLSISDFCLLISIGESIRNNNHRNTLFEPDE